jgi:release factor glutamine methyltransferase
MSELAAKTVPPNLSSLRRALTERLQNAGIEDASMDVQHILQAVFKDGPDGSWPDPDLCPTRAQLEHLEAIAARRETSEPLPHILGHWGFWSLDLNINSDVLTPRPDTERLVEIALETIPAGPLKILDLGTGSGAILLALLSERPQATGIGLDLSKAALNIADMNAKQVLSDNRAVFIEGQWDAALAQGPFDLVVSNPPYINSQTVETLAPEVCRYEPKLALDGGADGLDAYRAILPLLKHYQKPGGHFLFEIGADQGPAVLALAKTRKEFGQIRLWQDYGQRDRVLSGCLI